MSKNRLDVKYQKRFMKRFNKEYIYLNNLLHSKITEQSSTDLRYWYYFNKKINKYLDYAEENEIDSDHGDSGWFYKD